MIGLRADWLLVDSPYLDINVYTLPYHNKSSDTIFQIHLVYTFTVPFKF
jgi:hypothetical protein